jgi:hypothetical protein
VSEAADPIAALVAILKADPGVAAKAGVRVYGGELPPNQAGARPSKSIVVAPSGGFSLTAGSYAAHDTARVDLFGYGATQAEANQVLAVAAIAMRRIMRKVAANVLVHWAMPAGGAISGRDPALAWPRAFQSFQVFLALEEVTS